MKPADPMLPRLFRVEKVRRELSDTFTMDLAAEDGWEFTYAPGQFSMLYVFGVGEIPISISGDPADRSRLVHTTRAVGMVSNALQFAALIGSRKYEGFEIDYQLIPRVGHYQPPMLVQGLSSVYRGHAGIVRPAGI